MYKRKDGLWCEKVNINGKQKYFYGKTKGEVTEKIRSYHDGHKVSDVVKDWWKYTESELSPNTAPSYIRYTKRFEERFPGYIEDVTPKDISDFMDAQISEHNMAHKTASNCLTVANAICSFAVGKGYINSNPCRDIKIKRNLPSSKRDLPTDAEIKIISDIDELTPANFLLFTGLRRGEMIALKWSDIDMESGIMHIRNGVYFETNKAHEKSPKTDSGYRDVPIPQKIFDLMTPGEGYVFHDADGNMLSNSSCRHIWERLQKQYGFSCTPHQLRHAYTSIIVDKAGLSFADAAEVLGHADSTTTQRIYYGLREERKKETISKLKNLGV